MLGDILTGVVGLLFFLGMCAVGRLHISIAFLDNHMSRACLVAVRAVREAAAALLYLHSVAGEHCYRSPSTRIAST